MAGAGLHSLGGRPVRPVARPRLGVSVGGGCEERAAEDEDRFGSRSSGLRAPPEG